MNVKVTRLPKSSYQVDVVIPSFEVKKEIERITFLFGQNLEVPGFRKGKVPKGIVVEKVGLEKIKREALQSLLEKNFAQIMMEAGLSPVSNPAVKVAEIDPEKDLEITITVPTIPEVVIKDYRKIKVSKQPLTKVTDKQVKEAIDELFANWTKQSSQNNPDQSVIYQANVEVALKKDPSDPSEPNDEFAQKIGVKDMAELRDKMRHELELQDQYRLEKEFEDKVLDDLVKRTTAEIPDALRDEELNRMMARLNSQISSMGGTLEDYLKTQNKTAQQLRESWELTAVKNVTLELALAKIAREEQIEVSSEEVEKQLKGHDHKDHTKEEKLQEEAYYRHVLKQSKTLQFLKDLVQK